jgi:HEPN domain-containing protein
VNNETLARSYIRKATDRLDVLDLLERKGAWSDVIREAQETVELALKGMLRLVGIEPPKIHDVGGLLVEHEDKFPSPVKEQLTALAEISRRLRKERELALYGDIDFIPTEQYSPEDAAEARDGACLAVAAARKLVGLEP